MARPELPAASAASILEGLDVDGADRLVLVTGATGYVGGRLVPVLLDAGFRVRVLARHPERLRDLPWRNRVEVVPGDAGDAGDLDTALAGVEVAYYLIHAIGTGADFDDTERVVGRAFAAAAARAGVSRIVYLGGIAHDPDLSMHLRSRAEVGEILLASGVPTAALGAAVIIGSGSLSFEMMRYLTERLPAMITPRWVRSRIQPIAIRDVLRYLVGCADLPPEVNRSFDIGGPEVLTYQEMMERFAAVEGLRKRVILPVNLLQPELSARWVGLITPVPSVIARPLVGSLRNEVVCIEDDIRGYIPDPPHGLLDFDDSVRLALARVQDADVATRWSSASVPGAPSDPLPSDPHWAGGSLFSDDRSAVVPASPQSLWSVIEAIGGQNGWYSLPWAWEIRGLMDRAVGGPGLRRGRRDPRHLLVGEACDFWRVEEIEPGRLLRLRAEMRVPGRAWLEFHVGVDAQGRTTLRERATFFPRGLAGQAYWYTMLPFHGIVFPSMVRRISLAAEQLEGNGAKGSRGAPIAAPLAVTSAAPSAGPTAGPTTGTADAPAQAGTQPTGDNTDMTNMTAAGGPVSPFDRFGGAPFFTDLIGEFYARVARDPILRPLYPEADLGPAEDRLRMFLEQYWGGPSTYSQQRGHPRLRMRHAPFRVDARAHDAWLANMRESLDVAGAKPAKAPPDEAELWDYLERAAASMVNTFPSPPGAGAPLMA